MNQSQAEQKASLARVPGTASAVEAKRVERKHERKDLSEFLMARKQMEIAAQKQGVVALTHS